MSIPRERVLTAEKMAGYEELGFVHSVPILTPEEVPVLGLTTWRRRWWASWGTAARRRVMHLFFRGPRCVVTHPSLLDCLEDLLGPVILLRHTRIFYKYPPERGLGELGTGQASRSIC